MIFVAASASAFITFTSAFVAVVVDVGRDRK